MSQIIPLTPVRTLPDHQIARFKAKYGINNGVVASILKISEKQCREHIEKDSFPDEYNKLMGKVEKVIERTVKEANLLGDHAPFLQVLTHEGEQKDKKITALELELSNSELNCRQLMNVDEKRKTKIGALRSEKSNLELGHKQLAKDIQGFKTMGVFKRLLFLFNPGSLRWRSR